jgi:hypothetical protein
MRTVLMALCWLTASYVGAQEPVRDASATATVRCGAGGSAVYRPLYDVPSRALLFIAGPATKRDYLDGKINVFVCGALQSPDKMTPLLGRNAPFVPAVARGYWQTTIEVNGKRVPMMTETDREHLLTGVVWLDVTEEEVGKIEVFELAGNLRKRIAIDIQVGDKVVKAITYMKR